VKEQGELAAGAVEDKTVSVSLNASAQDVLDLDELRDLIGAAAGIDSADRAEKISIVIAPFYSQEEEILVDGITAILQSKYFPFIAIGCGVLLILLIVIIIVVAKAKKKAKLAKEEEEAAAAMTLGQELSDDEKQEILNMKNERSRDLRESVREFTDANPEIAAHMIKDWLHGGEDSGED
jgi:flagellar M-ring protein FliF